MAMLISLSIDVTKIDKTKIIDGKNGARYYNLMVSVNNDFDNYNNNCQVYQVQSKEDRAAKVKKSFLGSGRTIWSDAGGAGETGASKTAPKDDNKNLGW